VAARREAHEVGAARVHQLLAVHGQLPLQDRVPKRHAERRQQVVQRRHVRAACARGRASAPRGQGSRQLCRVAMMQQTGAQDMQPPT